MTPESLNLPGLLRHTYNAMVNLGKRSATIILPAADSQAWADCIVDTEFARFHKITTVAFPCSIFLAEQEFKFEASEAIESGSVVVEFR